MVGLITVMRPSVFRRGQRGLAIQLPAIWVQDKEIKPGEKLEVSRDSSGRLVVEKKASA